jgi:hypothetical protein
MIGHCHKDKCREDFCGCLCNPCLDADAGIHESFDSVTPMPESQLPPVLPADNRHHELQMVEYRSALYMIIAAGEALTTLNLPDLLNQISRAEAVGPILDPTLFRNKYQALRIDKALIEAAMPLWRHMKERVEEIARRVREGEVSA